MTTPNSPTGNGIQPYQGNPRYWQYGGQPVLLLGASDEDNLFQFPNLEAHLDEMKGAGGNVIRNTMSDRDEGNVRAFAMLESGKYDLSQWNPSYWTRFEDMLKWTHERGVFVQLEVWDRFDHSRNEWTSDPYNPENNVNYTFEASGFRPKYGKHPGAGEQPFFFTPPALQNNEVVLQHQRAFVDKLLSYALPYDHVLYCIDNETNGSPEWGLFWARHIKQRAAEAGKQVFVTEMWDDWDLHHEQHSRTISRPDIYDFVDGSQNSMQVGQNNWANAQWLWHHIAEKPRPINGTKLYGSDHLAETRWEGRTTANAISNFWRNILGGFASTRFHRPDYGLGLSEITKLQLTVARQILDHYDIFRSLPDSEFELLADREQDEAYAARVPGEAWLVFFPDGGSVTLLPDAEGPHFQLQWVNLQTGEWTEEIEAKGPQLRLNAPGQGHWIALIKPRAA